ncbi:MAG: hypothetical protein HF982_15025 [Desulfobacteraceae bacterium]|nr:hypothetical protein [Desulfobacteraceae bacterium]MBC2720868.1 hypothetical protein [Desulfobacteraceae bacterium]
MSKRENHPKQVVIRHKDSTVVWEKNSAGNTTKEGYSRHSNSRRKAFLSRYSH